MRIFARVIVCVAVCAFALTAVAEFGIVNPDFRFEGSPLPEISADGQFPYHGPSTCEVALLTNGEMSFAARLQTLRKAKKSIRIQALIFTADEAGRQIAEILKEKKADGLDVRVMVDAVSNPGWQTQLMYYDLKQHGIEVEGYEAGYLQWINEISILNPMIINKRYHDKLWIIDDEIAIVGGMNIANEYFRIGPKPKKIWRDQDAAVRGDIVKDMIAAFESNYQYFKDIKASRWIFNTDYSWAVWRKFLSWFGKIKIRYSRRSKLAMKRVKEAVIRSESLELEFLPAEGRFMRSRPRFQETYIEQGYLNSINNTEHEILMANAYYVPSDHVIFALKEAIRRGVKIHILTNSLETNDLPQLTYVSRYLYLELLEANFDSETRRNGGGVFIHEWEGNKHGEGTIHAKFAVFDRLLTIVGSYNMDPRSQDLNSETAIGFESERISTQLAEYYLNHDIPMSRLITYDDAFNYRYPRKIRDKFMLWLSLRFKNWL
jgi:putative cardiolipin synthase